MRRIRSAADIEKTQRRNATIMGIVFILLLVVSTAGFAVMSSEKEDRDVKNENGFDFVRDGGMWKLATGGEVFGFQNLPSEVSNVDVNMSSELGMYSGQPIYFVNPGEGSSEILNNIGRYVLRYQEACLSTPYSGICSGDLPMKNCTSNMIVFENGNETRVYSEGNCIFIVGDSLKGSDAFLFKLLGIN